MASSHRWRHAERLMHAPEIVEHADAEVERRATSFAKRLADVKRATARSESEIECAISASIDSFPQRGRRQAMMTRAPMMTTPSVGRNDPCPCGSGRKFKKCCIGRSTKPVAVLVEEPNSARWKIELRNFPRFREALGEDVMTAFCRCFIHADRLTSMVSFAYVSQQHHGRESVAFGRNLHTMVWFTIGTLRELARAIKDCRAALAKRGMFDAQSAPWVKLRDVEDRWERDETFRKMRDRAAFHVDADVIAARLAAERELRDDARAAETDIDMPAATTDACRATRPRRRRRYSA